MFKSYKNEVYIKYTNIHVNEVNNWCTFSSQNIKMKHPGLKDASKFPTEEQYIKDYHIAELEGDIYISMCGVLLGINYNDRYEFEYDIKKMCSNGDNLYVLAGRDLYNVWVC